MFTKVVSPPWSVLVHKEGLRERETGFLPHLLLTPATSDGSRTVKAPETHPPTQIHTHIHKHTHNGWFCCSLAALQGPPQTLARTGSRRARLTLSLLSVCFLGRTDGQTYRNLRLLPRKARWIYKLWQYWAGGIFFSRIRGAVIPLKLAKLLF